MKMILAIKRLIHRRTELRKNLFLASLLIFVFLMLQSCYKVWDDHYSAREQSVNKLMWDEIQLHEEYSIFVDFIIKNKLDTILTNNQQYTLFIPNNLAFNEIPDTVEINSFLLNHLISPNIVNLRNIPLSKKLQTLAGKFAVIEHNEDSYFFDGVEITEQSPLYLNGRFYEVSSFPFAKPNLNEYFKKYLPLLYNYINQQVYDSLDKSLSTPIGFDDDGNTIYDSVFITINPFDNKYFPITRESRDNFATFILFTQDQYNTALDEIAANLGGVYQSHEDIPVNWQESILLPSILENGIFENILTTEKLNDPNLLNINGKRVNIDVSNIDPDSKFLCSNGAIYNYYNFTIPDSLYLGEVKTEGESLIDSIGQSKYVWKDYVKLQGTYFEPTETVSDQASGGSATVVSFDRSFAGSYSVEITFPNIFPGRQRLEWRANYRPSGIYKVYVNDEVIGQFDTYTLRGILKSVTGEYFRPTSSGFNKVDFWVNNLVEYSDVKVRFEYAGTGGSTTNGFVLDYVSLISAPY